MKKLVILSMFVALFTACSSSSTETATATDSTAVLTDSTVVKGTPIPIDSVECDSTLN